MQRFLVVCGAGAVGCGLRYLVNLGAARLPTAFPLATLIVNIVGAFAMGLVMELALRTSEFSPTLRLALTTGFLGGLTTYSAFNYESTRLILDGQPLRGALNVLGTVVAAFAAGLLGMWIARRLT